MPGDQLAFTITEQGAIPVAQNLERLLAAQKNITAAQATGAQATGQAATALTQATTSTAQLERAAISLGTALTPLPGHFNALSSAAISVGGINPVIAGVTVGVGALTAVLGESVAASMQFNNQMGVLRAILPEREVAQFGGALADLAQRLGRDTIFSSGQAVEAMGNLARSGVSAENMLNGVAKAALDMAGAMGSTPAEAALTLGAALREFNLSGEHASEVANLFAQAVHVAGLNADEMRNGVSRVAPIINALGGSLQDTVMGLELLARSGLTAGRAATSLAQVYEDVVNPRNKQAAELMQQLGITTDGGAKSFVTAAGTVKPFAEVVKVLADSFEHLTPVQMAAASQTEFSRRAMQAALVMVNAYKNGGLDRLTEAMGEARTAESAMAERMNNLGGDMAKLGSSTQTLAVQIGDDLTPALRGVAQTALDATNRLIDLHAQASKEITVEIKAAGQLPNPGEMLLGPQGAAAAGTALGNFGANMQAVGVDWGTAVRAGIGLAFPAGGGALILQQWLHQQGTDTARQAGIAIGGDFIQNVAAAITAEAPQGADAFGAVAERLIAEFEGRGLSPEKAREAATLYFDAVLQAVEAKRPDMTEAGQSIGQAMAEGIDAARPAVINASARIASEIGAAIQSNKGNIEAAIVDVLGQESGPAGEQAVAQILQRGNAYRAVGEALNTLAPAERAHYEAMLLSNGANDKVNQSIGVLRALLEAGVITQEQFNSAMDRGTIKIKETAEAHKAATAEANAHKEAATALLNALTKGQGDAVTGWARYREAQNSAADASREYARQQGLNSADVERALDGDTAAAARLVQQLHALQNTQETVYAGRVGYAGPSGGKTIEEAYGAGSRLGQSIQQGIREGAAAEQPHVEDFFRESAADNIAAMRNQLAIRSPSGVAAEQVGKPIAEGVAAGIRSGAGDVADALSHTMTGALQTAATLGRNTGAQLAAEVVRGIQQGTIAAGGGALQTSATGQAPGGSLSPGGPEDPRLAEVRRRLSSSAALAGLAAGPSDDLVRLFASLGLTEAGASNLAAATSAKNYGLTGQVGRFMTQGVTTRGAAFAATGGEGPALPEEQANELAPDWEWHYWLQDASGGVAAPPSRQYNPRTGQWQTAGQIAQFGGSGAGAGGAAGPLAGLSAGLTALGTATENATNVIGQHVEALSSVTVGTGDATRSIHAFREATEDFAQDWEKMDAVAAAASQRIAANLRAGTLNVAGVTTPVGLTTTQIYGGTATGSSSGSGPAIGSNPYGMPWGIVSPVTPGTLRGFAEGPYVPEPSYLVSERTGRAYGRAGEYGPEPIGYGLGGGGGQPVMVNLNVVMPDMGLEPLSAAQLRQKATVFTQDYVVPALQRAGVRVH